MKERTISAIVMLAIILPVIYMGGKVFNSAILIISLLALKEFLDMKEVKKKTPMFVKIISYMFMTLLVASNIIEPSFNLMIDYRILSALFIAYLLPTVLYHDKNKYSINDSFYLLGGVFFLSLSFILLAAARNVRLALILYLILITIVTDTFAYLTGLLIGKHKMIESISPKKTWEGAFGGTLLGTFVSSVFYVTIINPEINLLVLVTISLFLSILGQFGDLVFSAIKRYFNKKDFSNLIPGHGGILDRLDSIIFVVLGYMFFWTLL